jgi:RHS repeat-associated protein
VNIQEYSGSSLTSTRQMVWALDRFRPYQPCEARNSGGSVTAQYFALGDVVSSTIHLYTPDHLGLTDAMVKASRFSQLKLFRAHPRGFNPIAHSGSTREVTNTSGSIVGQLGYDSYGRSMLLQGSIVPDFQFAGYYAHGASGLNLTRTRAYYANLGRFISRDPIGIRGGVNLYDYTGNSPVRFGDPSGLGLTFVEPPDDPFLVPCPASNPIAGLIYLPLLVADLDEPGDQYPFDKPNPFVPGDAPDPWYDPDPWQPWWNPLNGPAPPFDPFAPWGVPFDPWDPIVWHHANGGGEVGGGFGGGSGYEW